MSFSRKLTFLFSLSILAGSFLVASFFMGALFHELVHVEDSKRVSLVQIDYDFSARTWGEPVWDRYTEAEPYLIGSIIESVTFITLSISLLIVIAYNGGERR